MKKQIKGTLAATAALLAIAGVAQAAPAELNIYGASAQYNFWKDQAADYANKFLGCTAGAVTETSPDGKHGITHAKNCSSTLIPINSATNQRDLDIRFSGIASTEGIQAVRKQPALDANFNKAITYNASNSAVYGATICTTPGFRVMHDDALANSCHLVHVGTSDLDGASITQSTSGMSKGPLGGTNLVNTFAATGVDTAGLTAANSIVVPFGFFVNQGVTAQQCSAGLIGNYCTTAAHCDTFYGAGNGTCGAASTITNITREEATLIFGGLVADWSDLGGYFTPQAITACLRAGGSGTHATLDTAVIAGNGWGGTLSGSDVVPTTGSKYGMWFNSGSSDMMKCINGNTNAFAAAGITASSTGRLSGGIGYADADQTLNEANKSQFVKPLKYNGVYPTRTAIRNGQYEFFSAGWIYTNATNGVVNSFNATALANDATVGLATYLADPANIPAARSNYYATVSELKFSRASGSDYGYPTYLGGAATPQLP